MPKPKREDNNPDASDGRSNEPDQREVAHIKELIDPTNFVPAPPTLPEVPRLQKVIPPKEDISRHPVARWSQSGAAASITSTLVVPVALFSYLGYLLDGKLHHTTPYCALAGFVLGVIGSGVGVYNLMQRLK